MSFLYPRVVRITRPATLNGVGAQPGYGGDTEAEETLVLDKLPASIQSRREGTHSGSGVPDDGTEARAYIFIPKRRAANGQIRRLDVATDENRVRYQVLDPGWDSMGYRLTVMFLSDPGAC